MLNPDGRRRAASTQVVEVILSASASAAAAAASPAHISCHTACRSSELDFGAGQTKLTRKAANLQASRRCCHAVGQDGRPVDAIHR